MKLTKARFIILMVLVIPIAVILTIRLFINTVNFISVNFIPQPNQEKWRNRTSPLSIEQRDLLCKNFDLSKDTICTKEDVYGPDFYSHIITAFHPIERFSPYGIGPEAATYEEVEEKLGIFKIGCGANVPESSPVRPEGYHVYDCQYDLRGDRANILTIYFIAEEDKVINIVAPLGNDEY